jgi:FAD/FMN-containing dehydrogenase/Fe-S oxidoreductase
MIPRLAIDDAIGDGTIAYLERLKTAGFKGEISVDVSDRLVAATDNSVYQIMPQAVIFPRSTLDVSLALSLLNTDEFSAISVTPRGGGTGTNGQALNDGIIIDCSKFMNRILDINIQEKWVRVESGVVLDQLNRALKPYGYFFAPTVSSGSRATLGGMINTDACGKGSRVYGKTGEHIIDLNIVLINGEVLQSREISFNELQSIKEKNDFIGRIYSEVYRVCNDKASAIKSVFPRLSRYLSGYNLEMIMHEERRSFNLNYLIAGSEGTLGVVTEACLAIKQLPAYKKLVVLRFETFVHAMESSHILMETDPVAMECIDDNVIDRVRNDVIYEDVKGFIDDENGQVTGAIVIVEYESSDEGDVFLKVQNLKELIESNWGKKPFPHSYYIPSNSVESAAVWEMRKKCVGLLGNLKGARKPIAFVEDTAVDPRQMPEYISDFRELLDDANLQYGMFGHMDTGVLHVRPALDMKDPADEILMHTLTTRVCDLVKSYGGLLWGEHGKGFRSEYNPEFFGEDLFDELCRIKSVVDPHNQLNPGKIAFPYGSSYSKLAKVNSPSRGSFDRQISKDIAVEYSQALDCNGNGACHDVNPDTVMCPSVKQTKDRVHSPKGRAGILREWLRLLELKNYRPRMQVLSFRTVLWWPVGLIAKMWRSFLKICGQKDFSHDVYSAMSGCLACKACATQCPIHVDIPEMRSWFLEHYHRRYLRPVRDYCIAILENCVSWMALFPKFFNIFLGNFFVQSVFRHGIGIVDMPLLSPSSIKRLFATEGIKPFCLKQIANLSESEKKRSVLLLQDAFTSFYESNVLQAVCGILAKSGVTVYIVPFFPNGKGLHIKGFMQAFRWRVRKNSQQLEKLSSYGIPMVGIDPGVVLTYRDEYPRIMGADYPASKVYLLQEWLDEYLKDSNTICSRPKIKNQKPFVLMGHCSEKTMVHASQEMWRSVFNLFGQDLVIEEVGCCGMCGVFGHEAIHELESKKAYALSWQKKMPESVNDRSNILVSGHSCRSQVKRCDGFTPMHPAEALFTVFPNE